MKYKTISLAVISMISLLSACDANSTDMESFLQQDTIELFNSQSEENTIHSQVLSDGLYFAEANAYSEDGWRNILSFEVINGEIENITFDAVDTKALNYKRALSLDAEDELNQDNPSDLKWHEQIQLLESYIVNINDYSQLSSENILANLEGITIDLEPFIELFNTAVTTGPIELGSYQDGQYFAEIEDIATNTNHTIHLLVKHGYIIAAHWDTLLIDKLVAPDELEKREQYSEQWDQQANLLEQHLIVIQDPMLMTFDQENKTTDINGVTIEVHQFIELAVKALASGPLLD